MRKSFTKRIKITKGGKILRRGMAQDHFRAKQSGLQLRRKSAMRGLSLNKKIIGKYL